MSKAKGVLYVEQSNRIWSALSEATRAAGRAAAGAGRAERAERTKNGQRSRADGGSMGPNALDRENGAA